MLSTSGGVTDETGFSGRYAWRADENHFWHVVLGRASESAIAFDIVRSEAVQQFQATIQGQTNVGGATCAALRIQPAGLAPIDLYEDTASGAFREIVVAPGSPDAQTFDAVEYKTLANGRNVIDAWRTDGAFYKLRSINVQPVADGDLQPQPAAAAWTFAADSSPLMFATDPDASQAARVTASVNGHTGIFLLSTNTPSIVLYDDFARQAGIEPLGTADFSPYIGNSMFVGYARVSTVTVGGATLHNVVIQRIASPGMRVAGVLGYDFFANAVVDVDIARQRIRIEDPRTYQPSQAPGSFAFPVDLTNRVPVIAMDVDRGVAHPTIDTGLGGFMMLSQALRDSGRINGQDLNSQAAVRFGGVGATGDPIVNQGVRVTYTAWNTATTSGSCIGVNRIAVGPYKYENPPICFGGSNVFGMDGGLIGLDFLRHFNWTIDYPHARFILVPNNE